MSAGISPAPWWRGATPAGGINPAAAYAVERQEGRSGHTVRGRTSGVSGNMVPVASVTPHRGCLVQSAPCRPRRRLPDTSYGSLVFRLPASHIRKDKTLMFNYFRKELDWGGRK